MHRARCRQGSESRDDRLEVHPVEELHRDVENAIVARTEVEHADRVRMDEVARRLCLALEATKRRWIGRDVLFQELQGHATVEGHLASKPDVAHAAAADARDESIRAELSCFLDL